MQLSLVLVLKCLHSTAPATNTQNQNPHLPCSTWFLAEARQKARGRSLSLASAAGLDSLMFFVSCLFVLPGSGSTLIDRSGSRVFLLHRAHPNSAPSVLFAQHLAAVFVFMVLQLLVGWSPQPDIPRSFLYSAGACKM